MQRPEIADIEQSRLTAPDQLFPLLWRLIKVLFRYARLLYGVFFVGIFLISLVDQFFLRAVLSALLAFVVWPGRYGPLTPIIEFWRHWPKSL